MLDFCFIPLGVGDAFSARWYSSCYAIHAEGHWLLLDCPHPIRKMLREAGETAGVPLDVDCFDAILLSHLHADHATGLEGFGYFARFVLQRRAVLYSHPFNLERVWGERLAPGMETLAGDYTPVSRRLNDYFDTFPLSEVEPADIGPFRVEIYPTVHIPGTMAFRLTASGRTLGFSTDTDFHPPLIDWLAKSDLFVHETNHGGHTPYEKLLGLPEAVRRKMRLIHYPDTFDVEGSEIECLRQGELYVVPFPAQ